MDKNSLGKLLAQNNIRAHIKFLPEFTELIEQTGQKKVLYSQLLTRLMMIKELGGTLYNSKKFERLSEYGNLCAIHLDTSCFNGRILYFEDSGQIWLCSFFERANKRKTSYAGHAPVAISRRDAIRGCKDRSVLLWE